MLHSQYVLASFSDHFVIQQLLHCISDDSVDPFWPALHCFMVILDRLGSKVWGQRIDPIEAFQTIINNVSYNKEIQNIRNSSVRLVQLMCQYFKIISMRKSVVTDLAIGFFPFCFFFSFQ